MLEKKNLQSFDDMQILTDQKKKKRLLKFWNFKIKIDEKPKKEKDTNNANLRKNSRYNRH